MAPCIWKYTSSAFPRISTPNREMGHTFSRTRNKSSANQPRRQEIVYRIHTIRYTHTKGAWNYPQQPHKLEMHSCTKVGTLPSNITRRIDKKHPATTTGSAISPYFPMTFDNIASLKTDFRHYRCPNMRNDITPDAWEDIIQSNPIALDSPIQQQNPNSKRKPKKQPIKRCPVIEQLFGRIEQNTASEQTAWTHILQKASSDAPCRQEPYRTI